MRNAMGLLLALGVGAPRREAPEVDPDELRRLRAEVAAEMARRKLEADEARERRRRESERKIARAAEKRTRRAAKWRAEGRTT